MKAEKDHKSKLNPIVRKPKIANVKKNTFRKSLSLSKDFTKSLAFQLMGCAKDGPLRNLSDKEIKDQMIKDKYGL